MNNFHHSLTGQFVKNMRSITGSGYLVGLMIMIGIYYWFAVYEYHIIPYAYASNDAYVSFYNFSLLYNISLFGFHTSLNISYLPLFLFILPAIIISEDFDTRNFDIMRTRKFNTPGYYLGDILSVLFLVVIPLTECAFISEGIAFYEGYKITSGFLIDPIIMATIMMTLLIIPVSITIFLSILMGNKFLSIMTILFVLSLFKAGLVQDQLLCNGTWLNNFIRLVSFSQHIYSMPTSYFLGFPPPASLGGLPILPVISVIWQSSLLFFSLGFVILLLRKYSTRITEKVNTLFSKLKNKEVENE